MRVPLSISHPVLASQVSDRSPYSADEVSRGSTKELLWDCSAGHSFPAIVSNRVAGKGCRFCAQKALLPGFNDLASRFPDLASELIGNPLEVLFCSSRKVSWRCRKCSFEWDQSPKVRTSQGTGCPACTGKRVVPGVNDLWTTHPELSVQLVSPGEGERFTAGSSRKVEWRCFGCGYRWFARINHRVSGSSCPVDSGTVVVSGVNDLATTDPALADELIRPNATTVSRGSSVNALWRCGACSREFTAFIGNRVKGYGPCPSCSTRSHPQSELTDFVRRLVLSWPSSSDVTIHENDRTLIAPYELDIVVVLPEIIAVEFDGTYWHSDEVIRKRTGMSADEYHEMKDSLCEAADIRVLHVKEDDWRTNREAEERRVAEFVNAAFRPKNSSCSPM